MAIILGIEKVYDRLDWDFIRKWFTNLEFSEIWINWMIQCIMAPDIKVIVNGRTRDFFST